MSGDERRCTVTSAEQVEALAADWLARKQDFGGWSEDDQRALDAWLQASPAHLLAYVRLKEAWRFADRLSALRPPATRRAHTSPSGSRYFRLAAVLAVLSAIGVITASILPQIPAETTFSTPVGGHQILALSDGSRIELNTNTTLRTEVNGDRRIVWLDKGEAYFQIRHDAARPFVVFANGRRVTDLGTKFVVRSDAGRLDVALLEGRVQLDSVASPSKAVTVLAPGDEAVAVGNDISITRRSERDVAAKLGWQRGIVVFDHTTLADAAAEFNRYNVKKIVIADPVAARIAIDGTFPKNSVSAFVQAAREAFKLHTKENNSEIVISH